MRGKGRSRSTWRRRNRITPAYAGKRVKIRSIPRQTQDHPRLCGEKPVVPFLFVFLKGSPPPMRGKVTGMVPPCPDTRITPAYAGKRQKNRHKTCFLRDHPRLCGEKIFVSGGDILCMGSPPPMRGKAKNDDLETYIA